MAGQRQFPASFGLAEMGKMLGDDRFTRLDSLSREIAKPRSLNEQIAWERSHRRDRPKDEIKARSLSPREKVRNLVASLLPGSEQDAHRYAGKVEGLMDWTPYGLTSGYEAGQDIGRGTRQLQEGGAGGGKALAGGLLSAGLNMIPGGTEIRKGIRAYHGSPHKFDKFDLSKIGTGEGAQSYGNGLYFAENEAVARGYRDDLSKGVFSIQGQPHRHGLAASEAADKIPGLTKRAKEQVRWHLNRGYGAEDALKHLEKTGDMKGAESLKRAMRDGNFAAIQNTGHLYEGDIAADPAHFLDWGKSVADQSRGAQTLLMGDMRRPVFNDWIRDAYSKRELGDAALLEGSKRYREMPRAPVNELWDLNSGPLTEHLNAKGIPGIKYLDQGSRGPSKIFDVGAPSPEFGPYTPFTSFEDAEKHLQTLRRHGFANAEIKETIQPQTSNYVVFDPAKIDILRRYAFPLAAAGGASILPLLGPGNSGSEPPTY